MSVSPDWLGVGGALAALITAIIVGLRHRRGEDKDESQRLSLSEEDREHLTRMREAADRLRHATERVPEAMAEHRRAIDDNTAELRRQRP